MSDDVQRFSSTSSRILGAIGVVTALALAVVVLVDRRGTPSYETIALTVLFGTLAWVALLRPRVELGESRLVMRNMLSTVVLPLAAIEAVRVRQVLVVVAGERTYTSVAIGQSRRQLTRESGPTGGAEGSSYGALIEEQIRAQVSEALTKQGIKALSDDQLRLAEEIHRQPAIAEIALLAGSLVVFVALALT